MRSSRRIAMMTAALAALALTLLPAAASAKEKLTVPWTAAEAIALQGSAPDSPPPGSNDWNCKSAEHPRPVILVHGLLANRTVNWATISPLLANKGYCVFALTYGEAEGVSSPFYTPGGLIRMEDSAKQLKAFIGKVLRKTEAKKVDIVGHSEGSLMPNYYVKFLGGDKVVHDYVGVTPLWAGTDTAGLGSLDEIGGYLGLSDSLYDTLRPLCDSCHQFLKGSKFIAKMQKGGVASDRVHYTTIATKNDELVVPYTSGNLEGKHVENYVIQDVCPGPVPGASPDQSEHLSIIFDPNSARLILNALGGGHKAPPCFPVLPGLGAVGYTGNP